MGIISDELKAIIDNPLSLKSIASVGREGIPHVAYKDSLHLEGDNIVFYDYIQSSQINKNLVNAIWFDGKAAVNIYYDDGKEKKSFLIVGKPVRCVTAGRKFEELYVSLQEKYGKDMDLSAIWYIEPEYVRDESLFSRKEEEEKKYPYIMHLDRLVEL